MVGDPTRLYGDFRNALLPVLALAVAAVRELGGEADEPEERSCDLFVACREEQALRVGGCGAAVEWVTAATSSRPDWVGRIGGSVAAGQHAAT